MCKVTKIFLTLIAVLVTISCTASVCSAQAIAPKIGVRGGIGTDINGGIAYGVGGNYLLTYPKGGLELGIVLFGGSFEETSEDGYNPSTGSPHEYVENTDIFVFGAMANYLINYDQSTPSTFFIVGAGLASVSVEWSEESQTDGSLGTPVGAEGSRQEEDGSGGGTVFNLGVGKSFQGNFDLRLEFPIIVTFSSPEEASSVIPTAIFTAGLRF